jgi:hypothetical protein
MVLVLDSLAIKRKHLDHVLDVSVAALQMSRYGGAHHCADVAQPGHHLSPNALVATEGTVSAKKGDLKPHAVVTLVDETALFEGVAAPDATRSPAPPRCWGT